MANLIKIAISLDNRKVVFFYLNLKNLNIVGIVGCSDG